MYRPTGAHISMQIGTVDFLVVLQVDGRDAVMIQFLIFVAPTMQKNLVSVYTNQSFIIMLQTI